VFTKDNILKGFIANGQLDPIDKIVPSGKSLLDTFRGNTKESSLKDRDWIMKHFYKEMYLKGNIDEATHGLNDIVMDVNSSGQYVSRNHTVASKNRQRAKILSSTFQRRERQKLLYTNKMKQYKKEKHEYNKEQQLYKDSDECESFLLNNYKIISSEIMQNNSEEVSLIVIDTSSFLTIRECIKKEHFEWRGDYSKEVKSKFKPVLMRHLKAFLKVHGINLTTGGKAELIDKVIDNITNAKQDRHHNEEPVEPEQIVADDIDLR